MHRALLLTLLAASVTLGACTVEEPAASDDDDGGESSTATGGPATTTAGAGGSGGGSSTAAGTGGSGPAGPETSAQSLARQQGEHGWGPEQCPAGTSGTAIGELLTDLTLYDCEGNAVTLDAICGADAAWLFFAHGWCPHCRATGAFAEEVHDSYGDANLASFNVLVETSGGTPPTAADCQAWRDQYGHGDVITLHDPTGAATALWEENYTALNVVLDDQLIATKVHTDEEAGIRSAIDGALE